MIQNNKFLADSNSEISIREIQEVDLDEFKIKLLDFYTEIGHRMDVDNLDLILRNFLKKGLIILAIDDNTAAIVGFISCIESIAIYANGDFGIVNELYIIPSFRSKKIGKKLINSVQEIAKNRNWSRLELDTPEVEKSEKTINFYKKEGFVIVGYRMKKVISN
jgi:GNAT superfamily N-acetyltransferase